MALTLLLAVATAALIGNIIFAANATDTNSSATSTATSTTDTTATVTATADTSTAIQGRPNGRCFNGGFGGMHGRMGGRAGFGGYPVEVSAEFNATVTNILDNDTDVQNLTTQGYNVTAIMPMIKNVVGADGTVTTKATTTNVMMENGAGGFAMVKVDVEQAKVTQIVITTRTVINK